MHDTVRDNLAPNPLPCPILPIPRLPSEARTVRHTSPPLASAPSPSLFARTVQNNVRSIPCPSRPSLSLLWFSGFLSPFVCPASLALPVSSSYVPTFPGCKTLCRHGAYTLHCTHVARRRYFRGQHAAATRRVQSPHAPRVASLVVGHLFVRAPCPL